MTLSRLARAVGIAVALSFAGQATAADDPAAMLVLGKLKAARGDLEYSVPRQSAIPGLWEVAVKGGPTLYVSADGSYFVAGDLFSVGQGGFVNLAEKQRDAERKQALTELKAEDMIVFAPENPRATITVFTDVDCGYCRKFHSEVPELNRMGIAVHYLAFPRAGVGSPSYRKIATAWCSPDRKDALTRLKNGEELPDNVCQDNPVAAQMLLGERLGVQGTPALVLEDGTLVPGYQPAEHLARMLGIN